MKIPIIASTVDHHVDRLVWSRRDNSELAPHDESDDDHSMPRKTAYAVDEAALLAKYRISDLSPK